MKPDTQYASAPEIVLCSGDLILLLTDGIEEASAPDGTLFGLSRILDTVRSNRSKPAQQIVQTLYETVRAFANNAPQLDDITAILIKVS
jgi:sigma-B regulation protein RsbU (phosphoserine phosphatase)